MANFNHTRPYFTTLNGKLYRYGSEWSLRSGSKGFTPGDPPSKRCTGLTRVYQTAVPFVALHSVDRYGKVIPNRDLLFTRDLWSDSWEAGLNPPANLLDYSLAEDAAEEQLGNLFDFWQGMKDLKDALQMGCTFFHNVSSSVSQLRNRNFTAAARRITGDRHIIANTWLEYNFAILPTIGSIQDAIQFAVKDRTQAVRLHNGKRRLNAGFWSVDTFNYSCSAKFELELRGAATRYFTIEAFQQEFDRSAFTRPAPAIWDSVPWSFAIDWFVPIGTWLDQISRITQYSSDGCDVTSGSLTGDYHWSDIPGRTRLYDYSNAVKHFHLVRRVNTRLGAPTYSLQGLLDRSEFGLTQRRLSYLFAIAASRLKKSFGKGLL